MAINISSTNKGAAAALSNFTPHPFIFDGVICNSMEGFLQSLKFENPEMQAHVATLVGRKAKFKGKKKKWYTTQTLYWKGISYKRDSKEYTELIERAFDAYAKNTKIQKILLSTNNAVFEHSMGNRKKNRTVLTSTEFVSNLTRIRNNIQKQKELEDELK